MNAFTEQLRAFKPLPSWAEVPKEVKKDRRQLSDETIAKFREAMVGKGWFFRKDLEPILGMTRPQLNHALSKCLCPLGYVEREQVTALKWRYRWKETT